MNKALFIPYKEFIIKCINSCVNPEQLQICFDIMDRFKEQFKLCIPLIELDTAMDELFSHYLQKQNELHI